MSPTTALALRGAVRKPMRTALTAGIITAATGLLLIALCWLDGIFTEMLGAAADFAGHVRVVDPEFAEREQLMPLYAYVPESDGVVAAVRGVPGVRAVYPRVIAGATVSVGDEIGDVFAAVQGAPAAWFTERLHLDGKLVQGRWFADGSDELVLGATTARRVGAQLGAPVLLLGVTQDGAMSPLQGPVVGIVHDGSALVDQGVFLPLDRARWMVDIEGGAIEVLAYGDDRDGAPALRDALAALPALAKLRVQAWSEREPFNGFLPMARSIWMFLIFVLVSVAALGVWNTMMMSVLERTAEIGVLRAMGMTRATAVGLFVGEALVIAVVGGVLGILLGLGPSAYLSTHGLQLSDQIAQNIGSGLPLTATMKARISGTTLGVSFLLALAMALLGSLLPALRASLIQPVTAMRTGR